MLKAGQVFNITIETYDTDGASVDADSTPTATVVHNGSEIPASATVTKTATGVYNASCTVPSGASPGDDIQVRKSAVVSSVAAQETVFVGFVDSKRLDDLNDIDGSSVTATTVSDKTGYSLAADQSSVTVGTCTTNTDMRGTDGALEDLDAWLPLISEYVWRRNLYVGNDPSINGSPAQFLDIIRNNMSSHSVADVRADLERVGGFLAGIKTKTDSLDFVGTDVKATLDGEEVTTDAASRTASKADVSGLSTFNASTNTVNLSAATEAQIDAIAADTNELQGNQGNWLTATGFSTHSAADVTNAILAATGVTAGGTTTLADAFKILLAFAAGEVKDGGSGNTQWLDADDGATVVLDKTISETTPYRSDA